MLGSLEFTPFPDALEGLHALREGGHAIVVASNWDCSLPDWLGPTGLLELVDGVVTSADAGAAKPDPAVFRRALQLAGVDGRGAVHVGDSLDNDVAGARALGIRAILVRREGDPPPGVETVRALTELPTLV
jgi:putative hydrolase of the HAD superfamily